MPPDNTWYDNKTPCPKCSRIHERCKAHNKKGLPCGHMPAPDQRVCRFHGGAAPQTIAKAEERVAVARVAAALVSYGIDIKEQHPIDGLLQEVYQSATAVEFYAMLIAELRVPDPTDPMPALLGFDEEGEAITDDRAPLYGLDHNADGAPHVLVNLWNKERVWHARVCKMALDAGIQERQVRVAEVQGQQLVSVLTDVLDDPDMGLTDGQRSLGRQKAAVRIRETLVGRPGLPTG